MPAAGKRAVGDRPAEMTPVSEPVNIKPCFLKKCRKPRILPGLPVQFLKRPLNGLNFRTRLLGVGERVPRNTVGVLFENPGVADRNSHLIKRLYKWRKDDLQDG